MGSGRAEECELDPGFDTRSVPWLVRAPASPPFVPRQRLDLARLSDLAKAAEIQH